MIAGLDEGVGVLAEEAVVGGLAGEGDGVAVGFGAVAPAVENGENDRWRGSYLPSLSGWGWMDVFENTVRAVRSNLPKTRLQGNYAVFQLRRKAMTSADRASNAMMI